MIIQFMMRAENKDGPPRSENPKNQNCTKISQYCSLVFVLKANKRSSYL